MDGSIFSATLTMSEWAMCLFALVSVHRKDKEGQYKTLQAFLACRALANFVLTPLALYGGHIFERHFAYKLYFSLYWIYFVAEATLNLAIVYALFRLAMAPLAGIRDLGEIVFRWAGAISVAVTTAVICVPNPSGLSYVTRLLTEIQRAQSTITLSLLLFVCFAIRPLGLSFRSRQFGVVLSLGILAAATLSTSGWLTYSAHMYSAVNSAKSLAVCTGMLLCATYFILPEPKRRMVILPTTSPYLHWNQIAEVLGDPPGFIAIAGVPPEMFAPAELEVMRRASLMMAPTPFPVMDRSQIA